MSNNVKYTKKSIYGFCTCAGQCTERFISSGSAGIGLAIAQEMSVAGNQVVFTGRNREGLQKAIVLINTEFSAEMGGASGLPPTEVADEPFLALKKDQAGVSAGKSKLPNGLVQDAISKAGI